VLGCNIIGGGLSLNQADKVASRQLSYEYKSRRKALDALKNLNNAFAPQGKLLEKVDVFVSVDDFVVVRVTLSSRVTATDIAKAEGVFSGGKPTSKTLPTLDPHLRSFKEIYLGIGWKMFRAFGWQKGQNEQ